MPDLLELTVRQVMVADPLVVPPERPVQEVVRLMSERRAGAALVGVGGRLAGIFTERDLVRHAAEAPPGWRQRPVADWMTRDPWTIGPDAGWEEAATTLERLRVRHLPVIEHGRIVGIVSGRNLIGHRTEHLNRLVEERTQELSRANDLLTTRETEARRTIAAAGRLQKRLLLPGAPPDWPGLAWGVHYAPLNHLGGDYYDFARPDENHLGVLIADAAGHSIPAALVAVMARVAFAEASRGTARPGEVLAAMNRRLQGLTEERFVTAFYGVLERTTRLFRYANAGHPFPLRYVARAGRCESLVARGFMLGILPEAAYTESAITLESGDRLCFFTDGVTDARGGAGEPFGAERLHDYLIEHGRAPAKVLAKGLTDRLTAYRGERPAGDDLTVLVAEVGG